MANPSRDAIRRKFPKVQRLGYTPDELCAAIEISPSTYWRLKRKGLGPREMRVGKKAVRISPEAAAEWIRALEAANRADADEAVNKRKPRGRASPGPSISRPGKIGHHHSTDIKRPISEPQEGREDGHHGPPS